ncbi:glycosyltransferase [Vibrio astriarenae]
MLSIVIASYNGFKYISEQLESIIPQLAESDEIIVCDDGSTDGTFELVESKYKNHVTLVRNPHKGVVSNFFFAMQVANNDLIVLCDQDDYWFPFRLKVIRYSFFLGADMVIMNSIVTDKDKKSTGVRLFDVIPPKSGVFSNIVSNSFVGCHMAFNRCRLPHINSGSINVPMHDSFIGIWFLIKRLSIRVVEHPTMFFRRHENNASNTLAKSKRGLFLRLTERFMLILNLFNGLVKK